MKEQNSMSTGKLERATEFAVTGVKVGGNYLKHYAKTLITGDSGKETLHKDNAEDIYNTLSKLKGSALKVAQMLSMDRGMLPAAYVDKFSLSQYSAPPLSGPLVVNTFMKSFGKKPTDLFDSFEMQASHAASMGQVHTAYKDGMKLAVKVQYPGVADSVKSDLRLVKPFALRLVGMSEKEMGKYFQEVEEKLLEETDYKLELKRSQEIAASCAHINHLVFPTYYPQWSADKVITMSFLDGLHMKEYLATNPDQETRNRLGQAMWDFYDHQVHNLQTVHADPHPGNFIFLENGKLGVIDFGCIKVIPEVFYRNYFKLINEEIYDDKAKYLPIYKALELIHEGEDEATIDYFCGLFRKLIDMTTAPFRVDTFDFGRKDYFDEIYAYGDYLYSLPEVRDSELARGSRHALYINRTYFGLYSLLHELKAVVNTRKVLHL